MQNAVILNFNYWSFCVIYMELILAFSCSLLSRSSAIVSLIPLPLGRLTWGLFVLPMIKMLLIRVANWWPVLSLTWTMSNEPEIHKQWNFNVQPTLHLEPPQHHQSLLFFALLVKTTSFNKEDEETCTIQINYSMPCVQGLLNNLGKITKYLSSF